MRYVNGLICVVFVLFMIVQYNDPDALVWILIYGLVAVWAGLAAFRPTRFAHSQPLLITFAVSVVVFFAGTIYEWPPSLFDWHENELVREGLGMIIGSVSLMVIAYSVWRTRQQAPLTRH